MYFKLIRWSGYRFSIFSSAQQSKDEKQGAGYKGLATVGSSPLLLLHRPGAALKIPHCSSICCAHFGPFRSSVVFGGRERVSFAAHTPPHIPPLTTLILYFPWSFVELGGIEYLPQDKG